MCLLVEEIEVPGELLFLISDLQIFNNDNNNNSKLKHIKK